MSVARLLLLAMPLVVVGALDVLFLFEEDASGVELEAFRF